MSDFWECKNCGSVNSIDAMECETCGTAQEVYTEQEQDCEV